MLHVQQDAIFYKQCTSKKVILTQQTVSIMNFIEHNKKSTNDLRVKDFKSQDKKRLIPRCITTKVYICVLFLHSFFKNTL